jgi:hypothetical protein
LTVFQSANYGGVIRFQPELSAFKMSQFKERGNTIRLQAKELILDFMHANSKCQPNSSGMKLAEIFRECGFDWGDYPKTTSSNQQYWVGAIVQELKSEGKIERISESGPWRLI